SLLLRLRVGLGRRLQGPELEIEARVGFNQLFQALVILLHRLLVELAAFILIKVVIDLIDEAGEVHQQIVDLLAAIIGRLGIRAHLVDRQQSRLGELDQQLDALVRLRGHFTQLVSFGFREGITLARGRSHAQQQDQQEYFARGLHYLCSFLGGANIASRISSPNCSSFFSTASTCGRSSAASVRRMLSSARRPRRRWISVSFIFFLFLMTRSWARVAYSRIS